MVITHDRGGGPRAVLKGSETSVWEGLGSGEYTFTVTACYTAAGGSTRTSVGRSVTLKVDTTPPGPVTGLSAVDNDFGRVQLNWTNPGDPDLRYVEITCEPLSADAQTLTAVPSASGTYTWKGLAGGVTYTFTVKAVDESGNQSEIAVVTGTPWDVTPPGPVMNPKAVAIDDGVVLFWTDSPDADLKWIQIEHDANPKWYADPPKGKQTYTKTGLTNYTTYTFTLKAVDETGNRSEGVSVTATPPGDPNARGGDVVIKDHR